jgi:gluconate 2-dehydrogenase gamma chain
MADTDKSSGSSRRNFLKIGAGVVAGAAVATVVEVPYYSSVVGSGNSTSSTLQSNLNATQSALNEAQSSLAQANSQNTSLSQQLATTQSSLSDATAQIATLQGQVSSANTSASSAQAQATALQVQLDTVSGFLALSQDEQATLTAAVEAIIPTDSSGPGAAEAGVVYFIDRQLATDYGKSGGMYMQGPFVPTGVTSSITLTSTSGQSIVYPAGTFSPGPGGGYSFQYGLNMREFWRVSLGALETYSTSAYGGKFESLSPTDQAQALADLWNNKPTSFGSILPSDFAWELFFMTWSGFLTDPLYGGNRNMVGWKYVAFNGVNMGNFYGEGYTPQELMLATTATRLQPASLAQFQKGSP